MTLSLEEEQASLLSSTGLAIITLVKLTTYTDTASKTGPTTFYLSDKPVTYDYGNTGTDRRFWPVVASYSDFTQSIQHVPSPNDMRPYSDRLTLNFSNDPILGRRLSTILQEQNLVGADIEMSEIAVPDMTEYPIDLTALDGDEHRGHFIGHVRFADQISNASMSLACVITMPDPAKIWGTDILPNKTYWHEPTEAAKVTRLPVTYGHSYFYELLSVDDITVGTIQTSFNSVYTGLIDLSSDFPESGAWDLWANDEAFSVLWNGGAGQFDIQFRGLYGTTPVSQSSGDRVREIGAFEAVIQSNHHNGTFGTSGTRNNGISRSSGDLYDSGSAISQDLDVLDAIRGLETITDIRDPQTTVTLLERLHDGETPEGNRRPRLIANIPSGQGTTPVGCSRISQDSTITEIEMDGSASLWDDNADADVTDDTTEFVIGTGSIRVEHLDPPGSLTSTAERAFAPAIDLSGQCLSFFGRLNQEAFDEMFSSFGKSSPFYAWTVQLTSASGSMIYELSLQGTRALTWRRYYVSVDDGERAVETGSFDSSAITKIELISYHPDEVDDPNFVWYNFLHFGTAEGHYDAGDVTLGRHIQRPIDALTHWVGVMGFEHMDEPSRSALGTAIGEGVIGVDCRTLGREWQVVAQRLAFLCRCNLVPEIMDGVRRWRFLGANADFKFDSPSSHISEFSDCIDIGMDALELGTEFTFQYDYHEWAEEDQETGFQSTLVANTTASDVDGVTAADLVATRAAIGDSPFPGVEFRSIRNETAAKDLAGYMVHEMSDPTRRVLSITNVPWYEGYTKQRGDITSITPPWMKFEEFQVDSFNDTIGSDWAASDDGGPFNNGNEYREGVACMKIRCDGGGPDVFAKIEDQDPISARDQAITLWVRVDGATALANLETVHVRLASGADVDTDYMEWTFPAADFTADQFVQIRCQLDGSETTSSGTFDPTHIRHRKLGWVQTSTVNLQQIFVDDMRVENQRIPVRVISTTKKHGSQHFDFTAVEVETV